MKARTRFGRGEKWVRNATPFRTGLLTKWGVLNRESESSRSGNGYPVDNPALAALSLEKSRARLFRSRCANPFAGSGYTRNAESGNSRRFALTRGCSFFAVRKKAPLKGREMCTLLVNRRRESRQDILTTIRPIQPRIERLARFDAHSCSHDRG